MPLLFDLSNFPLWRAITAASFAFVFPVVPTWLGYRLSRSRSRSLIGLWLKEIGSDIQWLGFGCGVTLAIDTIAGYWLASYPYTLPALKLQLTIFGLLCAIAAVSVGCSHTERSIDASQTLSEIDKRNYLTLVPLAASVLKIVLYVITTILALASINIDITPFVQASAVVGIVIGIAVQTTLQDLFATLFLFTDRVLYVGDWVRYDDGSPFTGRVTRITAMRLFVRSLDGEMLILSNRKLDKVVKLPGVPKEKPATEDGSLS